jgi:hypothetical protein
MEWVPIGLLNGHNTIKAFKWNPEHQETAHEAKRSDASSVLATLDPLGAAGWSFSFTSEAGHAI